MEALLEIVAAMLTPLPLGVTALIVLLGVYAYHENKKQHKGIVDLVTRVEKRQCAHTTAIGRRLEPPLGYEEILDAEREVGVVDPKGEVRGDLS